MHSSHSETNSSRNPHHCSESKQKYQSHGKTEGLATQSDAIKEKKEKKNGRKSSRVIRPSAYRTAKIPMQDFNEIEATERKKKMGSDNEWERHWF